MRRRRHAGLLHQLLRERLASLDARGLGARPEGPRPSASSASTSPATSGASGPTTARPARCSAARRTRPSTSSAATSRQRASCAMPALPGAQSISGTPRAPASARTIACSRPPPPTTRTRHLRPLVSDVAGDHGAEQHERPRRGCCATAPEVRPRRRAGRERRTPRRSRRPRSSRSPGRGSGRSRPARARPSRFRSASRGSGRRTADALQDHDPETHRRAADESRGDRARGAVRPQPDDRGPGEPRASGHLIRPGV